MFPSSRSRGRVFHFLPTTALSRTVGRLCRFPLPRPLRELAWRGAGRLVGADLDEAGRPLRDYVSFNAFFTRRLREGARSEGAVETMCSPADGQLTHWSADVVPESLVEVKGQRRQLRRWLGRKGDWVRPAAAVIYLSPRDYHRVHVPLPGRLVGLTYRPGRLLPVNPRLVSDVGRVFGINERVTCWLETDHGSVAVCLIGALCVGGIEIPGLGFRANGGLWRRRFDRQLGVDAPTLRAGDELGVFHMGSSVVVVWEGDGFLWDLAARGEGPVRVGQPLGRWDA